MSNIYKLLSQSASAIFEVAELVRAGADVNARDLHVSKRTVLEMAATKSDPAYVSVIERLALLGADVNSVHPRSGESPLHCAALYAPVESIRLLCKLGANANALDSEGRSPAFLVLHRAGALAKEVEMGAALSALFAAGADPHAKDGHGVSLLQATRKAELKTLIRAAQTVSTIAGAVDQGDDEFEGEKARSVPSSRGGMQPL